METCIICGCEFEKKNRRGRPPIVCYNPNCRQALEDRQMELKKYRRNVAYHVKKHGRKLTLQEVAERANKAGMTYGNYVLQMERK